MRRRQVTCQQRLLRLSDQTQHFQGPGLRIQADLGLEEMFTCRQAIAAQVQQPTAQDLPSGDQLALLASQGLRHEPGQLFDASLRLVEASGKQQGGGDQSHRLWRPE